MDLPRIYQYEGLFSSNRSLDLSLKVLFVLHCFILLLFVVARHYARKSYKRAPLIKIDTLSTYSDVYSSELPESKLSESKDDVATIKLSRNYVLCVNDWKRITLYDHSPDFECFYSAAPKSLRRQWYGLLLSDATLPHRSELRSVLLHAFDSFPNKTYETIGSLSSNIHSVDRYLSGLGHLDSHGFDDWLWYIVSEFLFFNAMEFGDSHLARDKKAQLTHELKKNIAVLSDYHVYGLQKKNATSHKHASEELLDTLDDILLPLIEFSRLCTLHKSSSTNKKKDSSNLLCQLNRVRARMEMEGEPVEFLADSHTVHILAELSFMLHWILKRHLVVLFGCLSHKPSWEKRLASEVQEVFGNTGRIWKSKNDQLPTCLLLHQTQVLVWTKALIIETMRICSPSWPFGCFRQATRDGKLNDWDYLEDELILFNQPAYMFDRHLWRTEGDDPLTFNPSRFVNSTPNGASKPRLKLPVHFARFLLTGYTVCIPHESVYRLLISIVSHLYFTGWRVQQSTVIDDSLERYLILNPIVFTPICAPLD